MATLDALLYLQRLMAPGRLTVPYGINPEMNDGRPPPGQPSPLAGLPDAVRESIREAPSYGEGAVLPSRRPVWNAYSDFAPEFAQQLRQDPMEREQLNYELGMASQFPSAGMPLAEGQIGAPADTVDRRYSRPYNLGLGNLGALY